MGKCHELQNIAIDGAYPIGTLCECVCVCVCVCNKAKKTILFSIQRVKSMGSGMKHPVSRSWRSYETEDKLLKYSKSTFLHL